MPVHFLPVEDSPAVRITAAGLGTRAREALRVHLTLDLKSREGQVRSGQVRGAEPGRRFERFVWNSWIKFDEGRVVTEKWI